MIDSKDLMNVFSGGSLSFGDRLHLIGKAVDAGAKHTAIYIECVNKLTLERKLRITWDSAMDNKRNKEIQKQLLREYSESDAPCAYRIMTLKDAAELAVEKDSEAFEM